MTSKEALEKICLHCEHYHQDMCFRAIAGCEEWHKLEKDLEILDILKYLIEIIPNNATDTKSSLNIRIKPLHIISDTTLLKIKEWLDNEK